MIQPKDTPSLNHILKNKNKLSENNFGPLPYVHIQDDKDLRPWLCLNKIKYNEETE